MEFLIDGYNVIKFSEMFSARTLELQRDKLIDFILKYNPQGNNKVTIVLIAKVPILTKQMVIRRQR